MRISALCACLIMATACTYQYKSKELEKAHKAIAKSDLKMAVVHFSRALKRNPDSEAAMESAREASRIALFETEQFDLALDFLNHIVVYTDNTRERKESQKKIAGIYFDKLSDYERAIKAYSLLLNVENTPEEIIEYRFNIAKSYFYLNKFFQANSEAEQILKLDPPDKKKFEIKLFQANILVTIKDIEKAIAVYEELIREFPDMSRREKLGLNIAVAYEDLNEFQKAIDILKSIRPTYPSPEFIDIKINRLKQRMANLPGARRRWR